ncbi:amidohydrolase family protein [Rhodocytophaga aerolata]|uniref:Amidohydrolase family protein n=1 Tax=Rhodocytophaga aerolata TaxID=455078 RepID=A0ABT8RGR8_9BACT|nr:amidohydrolase family protein [Rhodocytophaga aerolata]MDO1451174.1 amidohydrolase family protein [Rhodocytophaga aerolata]
MKNLNYLRKLSLAVFTSSMLLTSCSQQNTSENTQQTADTASTSAPEAYYTLQDFTKVQKIDSHIHIRTPDSTFLKQAEEDNFRLVDINVDGPSSPPVEKQRDMALQHVKDFPERTVLATTFTVKNWTDPKWQEKTLAYLQDAFAKGAVGVKVWKNIGMELKDKNGKFVMIDDPRFDTIFRYMAKNNIPLLSHQGEPKNCWLPIEQMTVEGDKRYFSENPQYHMYKHPEYPSYEDQINARDHMLEKHPDLKVVSVHLASLEWDVAEIAKRLDKYPNLAVDMAARIPHLHNQAITDHQKVYDFFINYQDRILYATDFVINEGTKPEDVKKSTHDTWLRDWTFFATDEVMKNANNGAEFKGLKLPKGVIDKIYRKNAEKWIPGITKTTRI